MRIAKCDIDGAEVASAVELTSLGEDLRTEGIEDLCPRCADGLQAKREELEDAAAERVNAELRAWLRNRAGKPAAVAAVEDKGDVGGEQKGDVGGEKKTAKKSSQKKASKKS